MEHYGMESARILYAAKLNPPEDVSESARMEEKILD